MNRKPGIATNCKNVEIQLEEINNVANMHAYVMYADISDIQINAFILNNILLFFDRLFNWFATTYFRF